MRGVKAAFERTLLEILSVRELLSLAVVSVLFYAFYYPAPYAQQQVIALPIVVVDGDRSALSRRVIGDLQATQAVRVVALSPDMADARRRLREREAEGIVQLSRGLSAAAVTGRPGAGIAVILNGSYFVRAEGIARALGEAVAGEAARTAAALGVRSGVARLPIRTEALFNPTSGYRDYVFPAIANIILQQTLLFTAARMIAERRRRGVWRRGTGEALGTWLACIVLGVAGQAFFFGFAFWVQDVPRGGNIGALLVAMAVFAAAVSALGLFVGSLFRDGDDALKLLMPTSVPLVFLAGFAWPLEQMPDWVAAVAWLSPATAAMHLLVRFNQMGASFSEAAGPMLVLAALVIMYGSAWLWRCCAINGPKMVPARL